MHRYYNIVGVVFTWETRVGSRIDFLARESFVPRAFNLIMYVSDIATSNASELRKLDYFMCEFGRLCLCIVEEM